MLKGCGNAFLMIISWLEINFQLALFWFLI